MADNLYGASRCSYDKVEAGAFNDDTIYVAEQIIEKFYPKANSPRMVTEDEMDITLKKVRGRKYYEEKELTWYQMSRANTFAGSKSINIFKPIKGK